MRVIQPTFAGGEFSPSLYSRVDIQKYPTALRTCRNFIIHAHGGASNRPGTKLVHSIKDPSKKAIIVPFEYSTEQSYVLESGDYYCRFYMDGGLILTGAPGSQTPYEITTPYAEADLPDIRHAQSADVLYIVHPDVPPQTLTRLDHDNWTLEAYPITDGPFMPMNVDSAFTLAISAVSGTGLTATASKDLFTEDHVGALFQVSHDMQGEAVSGTHAAALPASAAIKCFGAWRLFVKGTSFVGSVKLQYSRDGGSTWNEYRSYTNVDVQASGTEEEFTSLRYVVTRDSGSVTVDLNSDPYTREGVVKVTAVAGPRSATVTVLSTLASTAATADWSEGSWSDENGYPSVVAFFQDRLVFARTYAEPQANWETQTGNYTSFARSYPDLLDTDGISVNLPSFKVNGINAMVALGEIIMMTSSAEWAVGPGPDGVFSPTSIQTRCQGYRGSSKVPPVIIGNRVIYVLPSGASLRDLGYDYQSAGYAGDNLSIFSSHLLEGHKVVTMVYQQEPDSIIWLVRDDGILLSLTYLREQEVLAWAHHDTDGQVESICSIPADGYDELWIVVKRGTSRFVERMERRSLSTDPKDQFFVDCGLTYSGEPTKVITGLDHLEGKSVAILADGSVVPQQIVVNGSITLPSEASVVHAGLPYTSDLETLNIELQMQDGTLQGRMVQLSEFTMRLLNSRGGWIGPNSTEKTLVELIQRRNEPMGSPIALFSGDCKKTIPPASNGGGRVFIRQKDPLPITVLGIMPTISVGGK
ncbi:E1_FCCH domain-containing protein [Gammaproteobacteria bacterium]